MSSYYSEDELIKMGFKKIGKNVLISKKCSLYGIDRISIGNNVRIDDFCILSGKLKIGNYVHLSAYSSFFAGDKGIEIDDFVAISSRCAVYAVSDDYSGEYMTNPMIPEEFTNVIKEQVIIRKHVIVGTNSTILPGVNIGVGAAIGAMSFINKDVEEWSINVGIPCKKIKERSKEILNLEANFIQKYGDIE